MGQLLDILAGRPQAVNRALQAAPHKRSLGSYGSTAGRAQTAWQAESTMRTWSASATAYRCVSYIATNLASVDLTVLNAQDEPNDQHPVAMLWNRQPNPVWSARVQKEWVFSRTELTGEAMLFVDRGPTGDGEPRGIYPIWDHVEVLVEEASGRVDEPQSRVTGELLGFRVRVRNGPVVPLLPSELLWLRYPHPFDPWGALAPWKAALHAAELDDQAKLWQLGELRRGGTPRTVVYLGDLDDEQHDAAVADFRANIEGAENAGRAFLVSGQTPAHVERLTLTPEEMSYIDSRVANSDEMMMAFGLRADLLRGEATWENQRASKTAAWSDVLLPKLEVMAGETDRQLLPDLSETAAFDVSDVEALREQADALWERVAQYGVTPDVLTLDEARALFGYEPLAGGVGAVTLTPYRALSSGAPLPTGRLLVAQLLPRQQRIVVTAKGQRTARVVETRRTPRPLSASKTLAFYDRHEKIGQRAIRKLAAKQERVVVRRLRDLLSRSDIEQLAQQWALQAEQATISRSPWTELPLVEARITTHDLFDVAYWQGVSAEMMDTWMEGVWSGGATAVATALDLDLTKFERRVLIAMETRRDVLAGLMTETTRQALDAQLLQAGLEGGESVAKLAARLSAVFSDLAGYRSERIARTETVGGYNGSSRMLAKESGVVNGRTWLATSDGRTRETHAEMDGETVNGMNARYSNGLLFPGDPNGDPGETINCRCTELYDV